MRPGDTSLNGVQKGFPETTSGLTGSLGQPGSPAYRESLALLCQRYWKPVYGYVRVAWAKSNEDAKDLAQAFFLWLMEAEVLERFDAARGSFRTYLKMLLRRFVGHEEAALHRLKRGGGIDIVSLGQDGGALESVLTDPRSVDPEKMFEKLWIMDLLNRSVDRVRERSLGGPQAISFQVYEGYDLVPSAERPTYRDLAVRWGLSEKEVKNRLFAVREEVRKEVLAELAQETGEHRYLDEDWDALLGS
ncbi:MAG TPA: sigma factor [Planctomycetota bacterium]|nr:sigma factor [Planctomycetota bacterium]